MWNTKGGRMDQEKNRMVGACEKNARRPTGKESDDEQAGPE